MAQPGNKWRIVMDKELRETFRDRRSLVLLLMFTLMYPLLLGVILHQQIKRATKPEREGIELAVIGAAQAPNLMAQLKQKNILVQSRGAHERGGHHRHAAGEKSGGLAAHHR